tara:strand:+ start:1679 stop:4129 length:2451 start_codon:yes stop_codon:yes gene_type:complete
MNVDDKEIKKIKTRKNRFIRWFIYAGSGGLIILLILVGVVSYGFYHFGRDLPDHQQLATYSPPTMTRVYTGDGRLLDEYATEKRIYVPLKATPRIVIDAFLSAEDRNFYDHFGVDPISVFGAVIKNLGSLNSERKLIGASTITQQVAKNFLLTNEASFSRKFKEAILAIRIEKTFTKDRILELYLNEIYLGFRSYGVAAASLNYFGKALSELDIAEVAFLAALPKAPNNYHPIHKKEAAIIRRNWVIERMFENGFITSEESLEAKNSSLQLNPRPQETFVVAKYFTEEVRRWLINKFGESTLYEGGLSVKTTLDPRLQYIADKVLRQGLINYDRRHGWRGSIGQLKKDDFDNIESALKKIDTPTVPEDWELAVVIKQSKDLAFIETKTGTKGHITLEELSWAKQINNKKIKSPGEVLNIGDIVFVEPINSRSKEFYLRQPVEVEGALVALDPHSGRVLAMVGGFDYNRSEFNRATQANRQPGSSFKPFVYLAAIENGLTPASKVLDAPVVVDQGPNLPKWKPKNYSNRFYGLSTLRLGLEKSQNLMTVRVAQTLGHQTLGDYVKKFGISKVASIHPSAALGTGLTNLINLTSAYGMLVNGGRKITASMIERIQDKNGITIFKRDTRDCIKCIVKHYDGINPLPLDDSREQLVDPQSAYQIVSMLEGVVKRGTGKIVRDVGKTLGGKTGTTNGFLDAWFVGFSPDLAVGVFVGYDMPQSLGKKESGGKVAAPIFRDFMMKSLENSPAIPFRVPPGIQFIRIDRHTGERADQETKDVIVEAFRSDTEPFKNRKNFQQDFNEDTLLFREGLKEGLGGIY